MPCARCECLGFVTCANSVHGNGLNSETEVVNKVQSCLAFILQNQNDREMHLPGGVKVGHRWGGTACALGTVHDSMAHRIHRTICSPAQLDALELQLCTVYTPLQIVDLRFMYSNLITY